MEKRALEAATCLTIGRRQRVVALGESQSKRVADLEVREFHGARLCEQLERQWWPDRALPRKADVVVTEIDSTYLKAQRRGRAARGHPTAHFAIHLGLHYSGRERRYQKRGSARCACATNAGS